MLTPAPPAVSHRPFLICRPPPALSDLESLRLLAALRPLGDHTVLVGWQGGGNADLVHDATLVRHCLSLTFLCLFHCGSLSSLRSFHCL